MLRLITALSVVAILVSTSGPNVAAAAGSQEDAAFVRAICGPCHATARRDLRSPMPDAIPFADLAANPAVNALALRVMLQTSHQAMPNISLTPEQTATVIAYILDLRNPPSQPGLTQINDQAVARAQTR